MIPKGPDFEKNRAVKTINSSQEKQKGLSADVKSLYVESCRLYPPSIL